ncbi:MAG: conjugative transposon protein TraM [Prolixibacteraceae bacterium]|nr:conjugative transposon protein TraM [Prolixibacteraceae bacterium]
MTQNKDKRVERKMLTPEQLQKRKKIVIYPLMFAAFALSMYFIFNPAKKKGKDIHGINSDLPVPKNEIVGDKKAAYEMELFGKKKNRQTLTLEDYGIKSDTTKSKIITGSIRKKASQKTPQSSIRSSAENYKKVNRDLNSFYSQQESGSREQELEKQVKNLQTELEEKREKDTTSPVDNQLRIMEASYKMAAKYMPSVPGQVQQTVQQPDKNLAHDLSSKEDKNIAPVSKLGTNETSALQQQVSDTVFLYRYIQSAAKDFYTVGAEKNNNEIGTNTVKACVHNDQVVVSGQSVKLRLLEPVKAGGIIMPENQTITGIATIQGERLSISVSSLEYRGRIIPVKISVYDMDGQLGIFIPGSMEVNALKEVTASMGQGAGTSISITQGTTAGQQLASDLGRSLIQGASQYVSKKLRTTKATLKAGHRLLLMPSN